MQPHYHVKHWLWKSQFSQGDFLSAREIRKEGPFTDENNFFLLNIKMIVFGLLARKKRWRQKSPGSRKGEICQACFISSAVCYGGKGRLHFIPDMAKVNSRLYRESLLHKLIEGCKSRLLSGFILQQDRAPAHTAKLAQSWILPTAVTSSENRNGHRTHQTLTLLTIMSEELCVNTARHFNPSQITSTSWRKSYNQCGTICHRTQVKSIQAYVKAVGGHFEHVLRTVFTEFLTGSKRCFLLIWIQALWWTLRFS